MAPRIGLGPVFEFEWLIASRRWRNYALRSGFVLGLLIALAVVAYSRADRLSNPSLKAQAEVGQAFFYGIVSVQLALIMLAAPAATAGAICLEKARGTLLHLLVTDLSDAEIVLGKLAARLMPTLMLVGCALPVMALGTLLGGIDPIALTGAFLITLGVAVLGCVLALTLSVWGSKTHEVLLGTYCAWVLWLLAEPMSRQAGVYLPAWVTWPLYRLAETDPFRLAFGPYVRPGSVTLWDDGLFLLGTLVISAALTALCVVRMRPVTVRQTNRVARRSRWAWRRSRWAWNWGFRSRLPGPSLEFNPVLWREWHRNHPSRWTRMVWAVYLGVAGVFSLLAMFNPGGMAAWVNGLQVSVGLLLLSVTAATSLAEERVRGSLDVLMTTPLSSSSIVLGKWLGAARSIPLLIILPALAVVPSVFSFLGMMSLLVIVGLVVAQGAAIVSLGLGLATWVPRLGRAVALTVTAHVMMTVGWLFLGLLLFDNQVFERFAMASPFFGVGNMTFVMSQSRGSMKEWECLVWGGVWVLVYAVVAVGLLAANVLTFNRCLGRIEHPMLSHPGAPRTVSSRDAFLADPALDGAGKPGIQWVDENSVATVSLSGPEGH